MVFEKYMISSLIHPHAILQIIEVCLISVLTSVISFGLPLFRTCTACPDSDVSSGIECPRAPGMYGNYVNVRSVCSLLDLVLLVLRLWM